MIPGSGLWIVFSIIFRQAGVSGLLATGGSILSVISPWCLRRSSSWVWDSRSSLVILRYEVLSRTILSQTQFHLYQ